MAIPVLPISEKCFKQERLPYARYCCLRALRANAVRASLRCHIVLRASLVSRACALSKIVLPKPKTAKLSEHILPSDTQRGTAGLVAELRAGNSRLRWKKRALKNSEDPDKRRASNREATRRFVDLSRSKKRFQEKVPSCLYAHVLLQILLACTSVFLFQSLLLSLSSWCSVSLHAYLDVSLVAKCEFGKRTCCEKFGSN